jgi:hypothetical protein
MNTPTRFHAQDRARELTTNAAALLKREGEPDLRLEAAAWGQLTRTLAADPSEAL